MSIYWQKIVLHLGVHTIGIPKASSFSIKEHLQDVSSLWNIAFCWIYHEAMLMPWTICQDKEDVCHFHLENWHQRRNVLLFLLNLL